MAKGQQSKKDEKKKPEKTLKEKRAEKRRQEREQIITIFLASPLFIGSSCVVQRRNAAKRSHKLSYTHFCRI